MSKIIFEDRYSATGIPRPGENSCNECDGMGLYPCKVESINAEACKTENGTLIVIGQKEQDGTPMKDDGWLIVRCPVCDGARLAPHKEVE